MSDDYYEPPVFFGLGSTHTLTEDAEPPHRLAGMRSVNTFVSMSTSPSPRARRIGFHIPKRRTVR